VFSLSCCSWSFYICSSTTFSLIFSTSYFSWAAYSSYCTMISRNSSIWFLVLVIWALLSSTIILILFSYSASMLCRDSSSFSRIRSSLLVRLYLSSRSFLIIEEYSSNIMVSSSLFFLRATSNFYFRMTFSFWMDPLRILFYLAKSVPLLAPSISLSSWLNEL